MMAWHRGFEVHFIWSTIRKTDSKLSWWKERLDNDALLELGDNQHIIETIEQDLETLTLDIYQLEEYLGLNRRPLSQANYFFSATKQLEDTAHLVNTIKEKNQGSRKNTSQCIKQLQACIQSVRLLNLFVPEKIRAS